MFSECSTTETISWFPNTVFQICTFTVEYTFVLRQRAKSLACSGLPRSLAQV